MTNLLEKSLLLGFSIFTLLLFSSFLVPFLEEFNDFNINGDQELEYCIIFIDEINQAVHYTIDHPEETYIKKVNYPNNFNITILDFLIICEFLIDNDIFDKVLIYNTSFHNCLFQDISPQTYLLNVSFQTSQILVSFKYI
ncbi:MAG: hypothetical protein ACXAEX_20380 [Promethearchaeota archaeon]|jgi:hypothetical protein